MIAHRARRAARILLNAARGTLLAVLSALASAHAAVEFDDPAWLPTRRTASASPGASTRQRDARAGGLMAFVAGSAAAGGSACQRAGRQPNRHNGFHPSTKSLDVARLRVEHGTNSCPNSWLR